MIYTCSSSFNKSTVAANCFLLPTTKLFQRTFVQSMDSIYFLFLFQSIIATKMWLCELVTPLSTCFSPIFSLRVSKWNSLKTRVGTVFGFFRLFTIMWIEFANICGSSFLPPLLVNFLQLHINCLACSFGHHWNVLTVFTQIFETTQILFSHLARTRNLTLQECHNEFSKRGETVFVA